MAFAKTAAIALVAFGALAGVTGAEAQPRAAQSQTLGTGAAPQVRRDVAFISAIEQTRGTLVVLARTADDVSEGLSDTDAAAVRRAVSAARFEFGAREMLSLRGIGAWDQILIVGLGEDAPIQRTGAAVGRRLLEEPGQVTVVGPWLGMDEPAAFAIGMGIGQYRSDLYATRERAASVTDPVLIVTQASAVASAAYSVQGDAMIDAMAWTRDVSNAPANVIYPESFVDSARAAFGGIPGVTITVLNERDMARLGMGALLGVGQGSVRPPRLLAVRYRGAGAPEGGPIALIGKGITFDSGGISIKPAANMHNMRMDMSGAASVTGAVLALARAGAPVDVVAISALAENMPDGNAIRPGDVLTAMNGMTIEVLNTDAEGRLVLADAIVWAERTLNPVAIIDVATLTGSVRGALGDDYAGLFSRQDWLAEGLIAAGETAGEPLFQLPLHASYASDLESPLADIRNVAGEGTPGAGIGAHFIGAFVNEDTPWAHLDIANMAWSGPNDWKPDGSSAFGVRLLERFVRDWRGPPAAE